MAVEGFGGLVVADIVGLEEVKAALAEVAEKQPKLFKRALAAECANLKKSVASCLRLYKVVRYTPVPNLIEARKWQSLSFPKRNRVTKMLHGPKNRSRISAAGSVKIESRPGGFEIGHFGGLAPYASRFQDGVPRHTSSKSERHWMYRRLGTPLDVHDEAKLNSILLPVSPPRQYIVPLAEKTRRDFVPGLAKCLERIVSGALGKSKSAKPNWRGSSRVYSS